jgi:hypothetical protein
MRGLSIVAIWLLSSTALAAEVEVAVDLSERRVSVGDFVTLEVRALTSLSGEIEVDVPEMVGLRETRRSQGESTSFSWSTQGGQTLRRERTVQIELEATQAGVLTVPAVVVRVGNKLARSEPMPIEVISAETGVAEAAKPGEVSPPSPDEDELFARYRLDKAEVYLGEQVLLDLVVYSNGAFNLSEGMNPPDLDGFWTETLERPDRLTPEVERVAGRSYRSYRLFRMALFPLEAGARSIEGTQLSFSVNPSIFSAGRRLRRRVPALGLTVKPLPTEGRPKDFISTHVGEYELIAAVDKKELPAGEPLTLTVLLRGSGNLQNVRLPNVDAVDGFRVFPPTKHEDIARRKTGVFGEKRQEVLLMPLRGGRLSVPSFELPVFNPRKEVYETLRTSPIEVFVRGEVDAAAVARTLSPSAAPEPERALELLPIRFRSTLTPRSAPGPGWPWLAGGIFGPLLLFLGLFGLEGLFARLRRETPKSRKKKAMRAARDRLRAAEQAAEAGDHRRAFGEIAETILAFASERAGENLRGLARADLSRTLSEGGAKAELVDALIRALDEADLARFAPGGDAAKTTEAIERAVKLLSGLSEWRPEERT